MRAAIHDPYLDTVGGGERYAITFAHTLLKNGWEVDIEWDEPKIKKWLTERLGIDLSKARVVRNVDRGSGYDLCFWLSDGSIPTLWAHKNILHFQTPFHNVNGRSLFNRLKFTKVNEIICNSKFTKGFIDKEYGVKSKVIYPPVAVDRIKPARKENVILFVGRYSQLQQSKRQEVLVRAFREMHDEGLKDWRLVIIGGSDVGRTDFVDELKKSARGYPIDILENLPFSEVKEYYGKAKIFWSASGLGAREDKEPEKVEHFGITVVESMAGGCVPIVLNKGGHREIVENNKTGFLWDYPEDLKALSLSLVGQERRRERLAKAAREKSKKFSQERFEKEILKLSS